MRLQRLRAPSGDGELLSAPPLRDAPDALDANVAHLARWEHDFQGRTAGRLRALARRQVIQGARDYLRRHDLDVPEVPDPSSPLVVTGHQPELFHPGVWVKNFAIAGLARARGGVGLNLIVDNDLAKSSSIRVPARDGDGFRIERVEYDEWGGEVPYEDLRVRDERRFASFADRVREVLPPSVPDPILDSFWPRAVRRRGSVPQVGMRFALARREVEASWGTSNLELPLSALCETEAFLWFASHLLAQLPRFQAVHNAALARYRASYRIRSRHHPVPALGREGDWLEAPFWIWRSEEPRRRPLLVRQRARTMQLRIGGEADPLLEIPLAPDREACCAVEQLQELAARRIRLRTRALTTTMFARLLLGDLFVHGIGGAKYDELGDEVVRGFFGIEPPRYLTLSMTLWLGLDRASASPAAFSAVSRDLRDLTYNPDRHLDGTPSREVRAWLEAKRAAIAGPVATRRERHARFLELRRCNAALQPLVEDARHELEAETRRMAAGLRHNGLTSSREYAAVIHSEHHLRSAMAGLDAPRSGP